MKSVKKLKLQEKTTTITIRVPNSLKKKLEVLSDKNNINLNLFINRILSKNIHWDEHVTKMGWLQFDPLVIMEIFRHLEEGEITTIAKSVKKEITKSIKFIYGDTSLEHTIEFIDAWLTFTNIPFRHAEENESHEFLVTHNLGKNWSLFAIRVVEEFIKEIGFKTHNTHYDKSSYSFTISQ